MCASESGHAADGPAEIVERLETLVGQEHVSEEYVRFRVDLLKAQWVVRAALAGASPSGALASKPAEGRHGRKRAPRSPALEPDDVPLDRGLLESLLTALCEAVARRGRESADVSRLATAAEKDPALLEELARRAAFGPDQEYLESLSRRLQVSVEALLFLGRALAAPFVAEAAGQVRPDTGRAGDASQASGHCSVCGSPAGLAKLREDDGRRILYCSLCGASWEFRRLECPYCGSCDREALSFLRAAETDPRWIESCEQCKGYIKTVDQRRLPAGQSIIPLVEETATLHLDLLAEREGYVRRLPYAASG